MKISNEIIGKIFNYPFNRFLDIVNEIIDRIETQNPEYEDILEAIDSTLIFTADQWEVMMFYQSPETANFNDAVLELMNDILDCVYYEQRKYAELSR